MTMINSGLKGVSDMAIVYHNIRKCTSNKNSLQHHQLQSCWKTMHDVTRNYDFNNKTIHGTVLLVTRVTFTMTKQVMVSPESTLIITRRYMVTPDVTITMTKQFMVTPKTYSLQWRDDARRSQMLHLHWQGNTCHNHWWDCQWRDNPQCHHKLLIS